MKSSNSPTCQILKDRRGGRRVRVQRVKLRVVVVVPSKLQVLFQNVINEKALEKNPKMTLSVSRLVLFIVLSKNASFYWCGVTYNLIRMAGVIHELSYWSVLRFLWLHEVFICWWPGWFFWIDIPKAHSLKSICKIWMKVFTL